MIKISFGILLLTTLTSAHASGDYTPKINLKNNYYRVSELCYEQGFVRPKDEVLGESEYLPTVRLEEIDLGNQRVFKRYLLIAPNYNYYNPISQKYEDYQIKECDNFILGAQNKEFIYHRTASPAEAVFYANLINHKIDNSLLEKWPYYQSSLNDYIDSNLESAKVELTTLPAEKELPLQLDNYNTWKSEYDKLIGGEQSGGGSGRVKINLRMSPEDFKRVRAQGSGLENALGLRSIYQKVVNDEVKLPKSKAFISKEVR